MTRAAGVLCMLLCVCVLLAEERVPGGASRAVGAPTIAYLEDPTGRLRIEDVASPGFAGRFTPTEGRHFLLAFSDSAHWFRFTVPAGADPLVLEAATPYAEYLDFFRPAPDGTLEVLHTGAMQPPAASETVFRFPVYRLVPSAERETHFYMRATSSISLQLTFRFLRPDVFAATQVWEGLRLGIYFGLVLAMALYNLFLYISVRDRAYLLYVGWVSSFACFMLVHNGLTLRWVREHLASLATYVPFPPLLLSMVLLLAFTRTVLDLGTHAPRVAAVVRALMWSAAFIVIPLAFGHIRVAARALDAYLACTFTLCGLSALLVWRRGYGPARYVVVAMGLSWVLGAFSSAYHLGLISGFDSFATFLAYEGSLVVFGLETVLFAFALADQINRLKKEKEEMQAQALAAAHRNELVLEDRVRQRTIELAEAKREAQNASQAKSRFLAAASHDLRQPLSVLRWYGDAVNVHARDLAHEQLLAIGAGIGRAVERAEPLIRRYLDIARLDAGALELFVRSCDLESVLQEVRQSHLPHAQERGLSLATEVEPPRRALVVDTDANVLRNILDNLVGNAIKFTATGGVVIGARRIDGDRSPLIRVWVRDTGIGIPEGEQPRVFEDFYQIGNPERAEGRGVGLGLGIARRQAQLLGTELCLASRVGEGSTFWLDLPAASPDLLPVTPPAPHLARARGENVLVIDDEPDVRHSLHAMLQAAGWNVRAVAGLQAARCEMERGFVPDVVVVDYRLGDHSNGPQVLGELRASGCRAAAVLITGDTAAERLEELGRCGLPTLKKPVQGELLIATLLRAIRDSQEEGEVGDEGQAAPG